MLTDKIDGKKIGFETGGEGILPDRPSVVLIHGASGSRSNWRMQMADFDSVVNVIALELPGHGESAGPALLTVAEYAAWAGSVLKLWQLPRPLFVAGHSMGGAITIELGLSGRTDIHGLILAATGANLPVTPAILEGLAGDYKNAIRLIAKWAHVKEADPAMIEETARDMMAAASSETALIDFMACSRFDRREDLQRIALPVLVVCGDQDRMTPPAMSEFLAARLPRDELAFIGGAGHMLISEQPDVFNPVCLDFIERMAVDS